MVLFSSSILLVGSNEPCSQKEDPLTHLDHQGSCFYKIQFKSWITLFFCGRQIDTYRIVIMDFVSISIEEYNAMIGLGQTVEQTLKIEDEEI